MAEVKDKALRVLLTGPIASEAELTATAREDDLHAVAAFVSEHRRREYLAWRALLYGYLGRYVRVEYDASGAPRLVSHPDLRISVSHCRDMVAVALSDRVCGVDMERLDRDFMKAAPRFLSARERTLSEDKRLAAAVWCAKECLYKMYGRRGMDLLRDLAVGSVDFARGTIRGTVAADAVGNAAGDGSTEGSAVGNVAGSGKTEDNVAGNVAGNVIGTVTVDMRMMITPDGHIIVYSI